jgi:S-DNA-T family DNA segregation ATPase FtsK/SpoIIIE
MKGNNMAENTYKKEPSKKETGNKKKESSEPSLDKKNSTKFQFLNDRRFLLAFGIFLLFMSFSLLVSFTSYFFTGFNDQSVVESLWSESVHTSGNEINNWFGIFGALLSYFLIYKWFGLGAFFLIPILATFALKFIFEKEVFSLLKLLQIGSFFTLWVGLFLGYISLKLPIDNYFNFICGGLGFELARLADSLAGWGTAIILIFSLLTYVIYQFNITSIAYPNHSKEPKIESQNQNIIQPTSTQEESTDEFLTQQSIEEGLLSDEQLNTIEEINNHEADAWVIKQENQNQAHTNKSKQPIFDIDAAFANLAEKQNDEPIASIIDEPIKDVVEDQFVEPSPDEIPIEGEKIANYDPTLDLPKYQYPPVDLLNEAEGNKVQVTKEELEANKDKIVETLKNYSIGISSIKATIGPTVTLYEIVPDAGIRISKIKSLEDDIALNLAALGIRIIAPMPGKGTIGIEVPNINREMVAMRSVLSTEKFLKSDKELPVVFGKTISNEIFVVDLAKMPHLLMAGATGQGKSVGLNVLLASLIYKKHPSQLKFVLVDPKKVELTLFNKIERHFLAKLPDTEEAIITDTKKVVHTLNSLCIEMDTRYDLLKEANCRNLKEYNQKFIERKLNPNNGHRFLPYIVLVIDELADLMMTAGKEVETPIARLAQLARAIGIHLVVATQRPSVNVITGIIKANFPARLSFKVTSKIDSRTILDAGGADQLIGQGDMLFSNGSDVIRLQCAFLDTPEVERICDFIGSQRGYDHPYHLPEFSEDDLNEDKGNGDFKFSERDKLFEEAARTIVINQQGSTSLLQRKLKLGYNRAGRLIDQLESAGIVGAFEGSKAREVLIKDEYSLEQLLNELAKQG